MEHEFNTPMMKQYMSVKKQYEDCLLFFRMGDFYELFLEDAHIGAKVLGITLTSRAKGKDGRIPMAGVPYHAVDSYLAKLVQAGYKVAICEQVSEPNKYGIVDREVIRIVTPGTVLDEKSLEKKENNYIISLSIHENVVGLAVADISTGHFQVAEFAADNIHQLLVDELARIAPSECILPEELYNNPKILKTLKAQKGLNIFPFFEWNRFSSNAEKTLKKQFGVKTLLGFDIDIKKQALQAAAALIGYLQYTQKDVIHHVTTITPYTNNHFMLLDRSTIINLELFSTIREQDRRGSLTHLLDHTITAMGGRLLRYWIRHPLVNKDEILNRHDSIEELLQDFSSITSLREQLKHIADIERILSRLSLGIGNARDLVGLKNSLLLTQQLKKTLEQYKSTFIQEICKAIHPRMNEVTNLLEEYILEDPRFDVKEGGLIKEGVHKELDSLRTIVSGNKQWIADMEADERERTGISSLKVRFNEVFGFYIEISKSNLHLVPENYIRKQTLVNGERFITPELKEKETIILTAEEKMNAIEYELFVQVLQKVLAQTTIIQHIAQAIARLDCILNFAYIAHKEHYVRPIITDSGEISIVQGRHPVVEKILSGNEFVPNDTTLNTKNSQLIIITGPNMAGKSVYIRQVAVITLLNQLGCFVPAQKATLSICDRIFVRSGASDVITGGLSTFMVEMVETAQILNQATQNSLIVMDEIGRGTSTYDGISIAWAVAEYLVTHKKINPKTLFATHYHELQTLEQHYPDKINNAHMAVEEHNGEPIFLHVLQPGGASHSFGVAVAKLAGVPQNVVKRAQELLHSLEKRDSVNAHPSNRSLIEDKISQLDVSNMTPLQALNTLSQLQKELKS